jgi:tyrosyl-tRNA synthetase
MSTSDGGFFDDMAWRGLVQQCTDEAGLRAYLHAPPTAAGGARGLRAYVGFDPTADSLTIGNLVGIMALARWQRAGHTPVALMGGATGLIGDPSGKSAERTLSTREQIDARVERIGRIFAGGELFDSGAGSARLEMVNNIDWLGGLGFLDALREIGKHFSVNMMIQKDSVKERLHNRDQGISYTEFSYMLLQAYDFFWLNRERGVCMQMGGSDQYGNIVVGMDLIGKKHHAEKGEGAEAPRAFGLTWPLVTKADGTKFGKTESGAVWLSADRTSPYAYYQFWLNSADADVERLLKTYTFLGREEIAGLMAEQLASPGARAAQRALARHATRILHGPTEVERAESAAAALFSGDIRGLDARTLGEVLGTVHSSTHARADLAGEGLALVDLLALTTLAKSKTEARQLLTEGSVSVNGVKATPTTRLTSADLLSAQLAGEMQATGIVALRRGKKNWHVCRWA